MPSTYHLTEPFPNPTRQYTFTGRGGAGNITLNRQAATVSQPTSSNNNNNTISINNLCLIQGAEPYPPPRSLSSTTSTRPSLLRKTIFGRGGFGNTHPSAERAMFSFDEELERASKAAESMAPIYHIGRGGQGNIVHHRHDSDIDASSRNSSASSTGSVRGFKSSLEKVRAHFSRQNSYN